MSRRVNFRATNPTNSERLAITLAAFFLRQWQVQPHVLAPKLQSLIKSE
jgi:hypothetical protein